MNTTHSNHTCPKCGASVPSDAPRGLCPACVLGGAATVKAAQPAGREATATDEIPTLPRLAAAFPQLEILELIGRGGMGFVFKARQPHLDRLVALKLLPDKLARDPQFAERFNREGRVLARLNHPNIVSVFDFGRTEHFYYLTMEYVDGVNLRQAMQAGRFSPAEALAIVPRVCEALQYAHEQGVLHRDIKPENILLDARGRVKIADFGIAKLVDDDPASVTLTGTGAALGTPHYMAPEQLERPAEVDHRADIYSLGVVFYEMLTGELPLGRFAPPSAKTPVHTGVDEVVFRTLERDREKRYQSAGEVKTQVEHLTNLGLGATASGAAAGGEAGAERTPVAGASAEYVYSFRAFAGAALVGLSLVKPLNVVMGLLLGRGGWDPQDLWLTIGSVALLGLGGTLVGWLALNEIREGRGRVRGLPPALFATLTWPLLALISVTLGPPMFLLTPGSGSGWAYTLGRMLVLLLPASVLTLALWAVYATARWATRQPTGERRGVLKWVFAGLLACAYGLVLMSRLTEPTPDTPGPAPTLHSSPAVEARSDAIRVRLRIAKGQAASVQVFRTDLDPPAPVPAFAGYLMAPDDERGRAEFVLQPVADRDPEAPGRSWRLHLVAEDGATVMGAPTELGPLVSAVSPGPNNVLELQADADSGLLLTVPNDPTQTNPLPARPVLMLQVQARARKPVSSVPVESTVVGAGSTNWVASLLAPRPTPTPAPQPEVLAYQWRQGPAGTNTTNWVRYTMTGVELRQLSDGRWLAMDFATDVQGDCQRFFRVDGNGFRAVTRTTEFRLELEGSPPVKRQRVEWLLPEAVKEAEALAYRDTIEREVVRRSLTVYEGEQRPLFRLPIGTIGDLSVGLGARKLEPEADPSGGEPRPTPDARPRQINKP